MIRLDKFCSAVFIIAFALMLPSVKLLGFADELIAAILGALAVVDCLFNRSWRRYTLLWIIIGIMTFYAAYSMVFMNYNTPAAIFVDWIIELKPFVPFIVFLAIRPQLSAGQKQILRIIAIINAVASTILLLIPGVVMRALVVHVYIPGNALMLSAILYAYTSGDACRTGRNAIVIVLMLCAGLLCTRSKYYGTFIVALYFLFIYTPGMLRHMSPRRLALFITVPALILAAAWGKIDYYFISGGQPSNSLDPEVLESFARPVMYATGALVLIHHIPFGSGLASFASWASASSYSSLYHKYGISNVYGLSPSNSSFVCDAFYPSLAQFGFVGIALFCTFWIYIASMLKKIIRSNSESCRTDFACGWIIICFILIESVAGNTFVQTQGMCAMMLLGLICSKAQGKLSVETSVNLPHQTDGK
jgi:hypothetical protein